MSAHETADLGERVHRVSQGGVLLATVDDFGAGGATQTGIWVPCGWASLIVCVIDVTTFTRPDGDEELDVYFQTTYDHEDTPVDLENVHLTGTGKRICVFTGPFASVDTPITPSDGALADDTKVDLPPGEKFRVKVKVTDATNNDAAVDATVKAFMQS